MIGVSDGAYKEYKVPELRGSSQVIKLGTHTSEVGSLSLQRKGCSFKDESIIIFPLDMLNALAIYPMAHVSWHPNFSDYLDSLVLNFTEESIGIIRKIKHKL